MPTSPAKLYFIYYSKGWWIISPSANKRLEVARASSLGGAMAWVRDRQEKPR